MKKIALLIITLSFTALLMCGCYSAPVLFEMIDVYDNMDLSDQTLLIENEYLRLEFDCATTQFSLTDKARGNVWYSNPPDVDGDPIAVQGIKDRMRSQIVLTYGQMSGTTTEINNYTLSVANETYDWEATENSIKVRYTIGRVEKIFICPPAMYESRFLEYRDLMNSEQQGMMNNYYRIIDIERLRVTDNRDEILEKYPDIIHERVFELREELQPHIMERIETAFEEAGYTYEDFIADSIGSESLQSESPVFNISIVYTLDGPDFVVSVPRDEIEYRHSYPVLSMLVLPYFGAAGSGEAGFTLVPDASGALIYNNNDKQNQQSYSVSVYGFDTALKRSYVISENFAYMPLFGVSREDSAFLCVIEEGDSGLAIEADVSGRTHTYNTVNTRYTVINWDDVDISKANVIAKAFDRNEMTGELRQRYIFLSDPGYVSMAQAYREYLIARYPLPGRHNETDLPIVLSLLGAINKTENIMGVPTERSFPLTTYDEAADIIKRFASAGINSLRVNYNGWFNNGVLHDAPGDIKLISSLGGKKGFNNLVDTAKSNGAELFFEADFTFIHNKGTFNGFVINRDSAKRLSREVVRIYPFDFASFEVWDGNYGKRYSYYLANNEYTMRAIDSFYDGLTRLGGGNITFSSIGRSLNSDFNIKKPASRNDVMNLQTAKLAELNANGAKVMIHGGNAYAVPFADIVIDMPLEANNFTIVDESIPFYQIVLHGMVPYTSSPLNLAPDYERSILQTVESGAGLQFMFMNEAGEQLLETFYTRYFASDLERWGDRPIELYNKLNSELRHTAAQYITGHSILAPMVRLTEYEDGTRVVVNYSSSVYTYEGVAVGAMDFEVIRN